MSIIFPGHFWADSGPFLALLGSRWAALGTAEKNHQSCAYAPHTMTQNNTLLTRKDLAARWKVSIETLKRRERARLIMPIRLDGRIVRYRMDDILRAETDGGAQ